MDASGEVPRYVHHYRRHSEPEEHPRSPESHVIRDSAFWAAEALACDMDPSVSYSPDVMKEPIDHWLQENRPSILYRSDGVGWIEVFAPSKMRTEKGPAPDVIRLQEAWESYQKSGEPINIDTITNLAKTFQATSGKWLFHVDTGDKVDLAWAKVAKAVVSGNLCNYAKVSPFDLTESGSHVCCMYNNDFTKEDEVMALDKRIRACGIYTSLLYKPDVYTYLGIYRDNEWQVRPTIYKSVFDVVTRQSIVTPVK